MYNKEEVRTNQIKGKDIQMKKLLTITDHVDGMESTVFDSGDGYRVLLRDTDALASCGVFLIPKTLKNARQMANRKAAELAGVVWPEKPTTIPIWNPQA